MVSRKISLWAPGCVGQGLPRVFSLIADNFHSHMAETLCNPRLELMAVHYARKKPKEEGTIWKTGGVKMARGETFKECLEGDASRSL